MSLSSGYILGRYPKIRENHVFWYSSYPVLAAALRLFGRETLSLPNRSATRRRDLSPVWALTSRANYHLPFSRSIRCPNLVMPAPIIAEIKLSPTLSWVGMKKKKGALLYHNVPLVFLDTVRIFHSSRTDS